MYARDAILDRIRPTEAERAKVLDSADALLEEARKASAGRCEPILVGSVAKGTYLVDPDIDVFLLFPEETTREELERVGLEVGKAILGGETRYAEHPYTHGMFQGFEADVVPCYAIEDASMLKSNVDRTPFHTEYVMGNMPDGLRDDVLLMKAFNKGIGTYGAEIRVEGFSGYLCEILVMKYGGFEGVLEASGSWGRDPVHVVDPPMGGDAWRAECLGPNDNRFTRNLNVVDPVDASRNVSSAVSRDSMSIFMFAAQEYLAAPDERFFFPNPRTEPSPEEAAAWSGSRVTNLAVVVMERPDLIDDVLYSQVKKAHGSLRESMVEAGFLVLTDDHLVGESIEMAFEFHPDGLPPLMIRRGPPVSDKNAVRFREKWTDSVFISGDRLWAEVPRPETTPEGVLRKALGDRGMGKNLVKLAGSASILLGEEAAARSGAMSLLMDRRTPWTR